MFLPYEAVKVTLFLLLVFAIVCLRIIKNEGNKRIMTPSILICVGISIIIYGCINPLKYPMLYFMLMESGVILIFFSLIRVVEVCAERTEEKENKEFNVEKYIANRLKGLNNILEDFKDIKKLTKTKKVDPYILEFKYRIREMREFQEDYKTGDEDNKI